MKKSALIGCLILFFASLCFSSPKNKKPLWADLNTINQIFPSTEYVTGLAQSKNEQTAIALADSINEEFDGAYEYVYDRSQKRAKRDAKELGISAVRGGSIVGEHDVIFAGADEVITFSHTAYSRAVFGKGAVEAAKFLAGKAPGMYNMSHVING